MDNHMCYCGKKAVGLISGEGWLCKDCFDDKDKKLVFFIYIIFFKPETDILVLC